MVRAEACRVGDADWEVGEDGEETIVYRGSKGEVMTDFVDGQKEVLVGRGSNEVGGEEEWPG